MEDEETRAKGTRHTGEFKAKAARLLTENIPRIPWKRTRSLRGGEKSKDQDAAILAQQVGVDSRGGVEMVGRGRNG